jgi:UDP-GlcNAc:undecaprenyl-phosphate GlcNAc-1-phosphate transferase
MVDWLTIAQATDDALRFTADEVVGPYMFVFYAAFLMCFITTPIMRKLALANGIVDWPDHRRKAHLEPIAYLGGVALFLGWLAGVVVAFMLTPHSAVEGKVVLSIDFPTSILFGAAIICGVGVIDDVYGISPRVKVGGQLLAAALLASQTVGTELAAGVIAAVAGSLGLDPNVIPGFGAEIAWHDPSYWVGTAFVTLLVLGGCNALNLIDGLDGLSSGVTGIFALGVGFISVALAMGTYGPEGAFSPYDMDPVRVVMCLALLGTVLGYLPYNFNPANIFMGDAGSLLLGYLSVTMILLLAERGDPQLVMAGLIVFALPILDTSLAIVRRKMRGQPIFSPDNQHLHHQLIRAGLGVKQAVLVLYAAAGMFAVIGASLIFLRLRYVAGFFIVFFGFIVVMAYKVGHRQFLLLQATEKAKADAKAQKEQAKDTAAPAQTAITAAAPDDEPTDAPKTPPAAPGVEGQA